MPESSAPTRAATHLELRHVQLLRAGIAALAAVMITFSQDHSAELGLGVFSGFAFATGLIFALAAWLTFERGQRAPYVALAAVSLAAGMVGSVSVWRTSEMFFVLVIGWALVTGLIELLTGVRARRAMRRDAVLDPQRSSDVRDAITIGILGLVLVAAIAVIPVGYKLDYFIAEAGPDGQSFTLTGITIAVGIVGAYAAVVAVFLGIAGFSPRRPAPAQPDAATSGAAE